MTSINTICQSVSLELYSKSIKAATLINSWVYYDKTAVFEYNINGRPITFDIVYEDNCDTEIKVFSRNNKNTDTVAKLGLSPSNDGRFFVKSLKKELSHSELTSSICSSIRAVVDQIAEFGRHSSDNALLGGLGALSPLVVADIGANYLSEPPYLALQQVGLCQIVGFEPQPEAFSKLQTLKGDNEVYFPYAIGLPGKLELNIYNYSGFTSRYKIDERTISIANDWFGGTRLKEVEIIECTSLDSIPDMPKFDVLKIDIQGGEMDVFQTARRSIESAICIITEVAFFPLYDNAPTFADIHTELLSQGFLLHKFLHFSRINVSSSCDDSIRGIGNASQIIDGDAVYIRDYRNVDLIDATTIKKYALLGHFLFDSKDLTIKMLDSLEKRGEIKKDSTKKYALSLK